MAVTTVNNSDVYTFFAITGGLTLAYSLSVLFSLSQSQIENRIGSSGFALHGVHGPSKAHAKH
jgi:hypothetical protein